MKILVLSPHRDDAAFSLSFSIAHWLAAGHSVTIMNVFTRSLYAPYSDAESVHENDRLSYVSAMRKREDEAFLRQVPGADMIDLNIKDAPIRLHCDSAIVCDMEIDPQDKAIAKIHNTVEKHLRTPHCLVIPLALGHHVDHRVVRDAVLPLTPDIPCAFYEELPYAARDGVRIDLSRFREDTAQRFHEELHPVLVHGTQTRPTEHKRKLALMYSSQIDAALADTIAQFSHRYHGAERQWANEAWLKLARSQHLSTRQRDENAEPLPD